MKRVFLSHKFRDNPEQNFAEILEIGRKLAKLNIAYFSPITNYCALDDTDGAQREFGLKCCEEWIPYCDELWLFGDWEKSEGCQREHLTALLELIPVYIVIGWAEDELPIFAGEMPEWIRRNK